MGTRTAVYETRTYGAVRGRGNYLIFPPTRLIYERELKMSYESLEFLYVVFVLSPAFTMIHEFGHALFGLLAGGKIESIVIGTGKRLFNLGIVHFNILFFLTANCRIVDMKRTSKTNRILFYLGGPLLNIVSAGLVYFIARQLGVNNRLIFLTYMLFLVVGIGNLIPFETKKGAKSDGMRIYSILKHGVTQQG